MSLCIVFLTYFDRLTTYLTIIGCMILCVTSNRIKSYIIPKNIYNKHDLFINPPTKTYHNNSDSNNENNKLDK